MKLPIAGESYQNRQIASGAQESLNFYRETIEDPSGSGKSTKILRPAPGAHLLVNQNANAGNVRGLWSGAGRCFVVVGAYLYEIDNAGATVSTHALGVTNLGKPVWMAGNGNQLGIVADGYFLIDNGSGPVQARFQISGVVTAAGAVLTWTSGDKFTPEMAGINFFLSDQAVTVLTYTDSTHVTLTGTWPGSGTGTVNTFYFIVYWRTGDYFTAGMEGNPIVINGVTYTVDKVQTIAVLTLTTDTAGQQSAVAYSATQANLVYEAAAGDLVTATTGAFLDDQFYVQRPSGSIPILQSYTDLVIGAAATDVSSAAHPFILGNVGQILVITAGTGFTPGQYTIASFLAGVVTLDRAVGTVASVGGSGARYASPPNSDLGRQVNFSAVNDGTSWSGLDFKIKETAPDYIQSIFADREQLYVFGQDYVSEVWQNDPNTGRPERLNGSVIGEPNAARYGVVSMQGHVYFIGGGAAGNPVAYRLDGFTPTRISTHAVEQAWALKGVAVSTAVAWDYTEDGHYFWVIWWSSGSTWVYDATEKSWHERTAWVAAAYAAYRWKFHTFIPEWGTNGQHIVGDYSSAKILIMSSAFYDDESTDMKQVRILPYIFAGGNKRVYVNRLDLAMATGLIPSGTEPTITLEWSLDNGLTWSTPEAAGFGLHDETNKRVYWIAQGSAETAMMARISITGQSQTVLIDCEVEVYLGDS